jgi:hypothetical protein
VAAAAAPAPPPPVAKQLPIRVFTRVGPLTAAHSVVATAAAAGISPYVPDRLFPVPDRSLPVPGRPLSTLPFPVGIRLVRRFPRRPSTLWDATDSVPSQVMRHKEEVSHGDPWLLLYLSHPLVNIINNKLLLNSATNP